ncbi:ABC transporter substrate-binding protein [Sulfitobacter sp. CW3]|uniref:ABC transporter substrate-binding protein n=1 Tax=Sulfitobacter sp. CW3 TaxID=2861965 RepID=UPI001C5ED0CB|nr:ABC transporter substrate-binding protein [Sulfitobacter sp. CW3]MBW4963511.1 ABC transporter substrate-binding protein [Sulfitobacter sp. CW3]
MTLALNGYSYSKGAARGRTVILTVAKDCESTAKAAKPDARPALLENPMRLATLLCLISLVFVPLRLSADPIRITHSFGETRIENTPQRIVSVGYHEQDFLYAMGIAPVGVHEWFGGNPYATWSWAENARETLDAKPDVQRGFEIDLEWVWQKKPDLIVATFAPLDRQTYDKLSQIAPVVGPPSGYKAWTAPWQEEMRLIAQATGRKDQGDAVIAKVEAELANLADAYPELSDAEVAVAYVTGTELIGYSANDGSNRLMASLGLKVPAEYDRLAAGSGNFSVSLERLDLFDKDVALWLADENGRALIEGLPAYREGALSQNDRSVWANTEEIGAMSFQSPLSILWVAERLMPRLAKAVNN